MRSCFLVILVLSINTAFSQAFGQNYGLSVTNSKLIDSVHPILKNLKSIYSNKIKDKFNYELEFSIEQEFFPTLNGSFPEIDEITENAKVTIRLYIGGNELGINRPYSPLHLLQIACHEIGHGLGNPKETGISSEGESDYFVASCMAKYLEKFSITNEYVDLLTIDSDVKEVCNINAPSFCQIILQSSKDVLSQFWNSPDYNYLLQSHNMHQGSTEGYPDSQCRLDIIKDSLLRSDKPVCF
jgi:hypothetical protein